MLTLLVLFGTFLIIAFLAAVLMGMAAVMPAVLVIIALPVGIDILILKKIFGKKKKEK